MRSRISEMIPAPVVASSRLETPRRILTYCFVAVGLWYLGWRLKTFNPHAPIFSMLIYGAELFGFITALMHVFMCWRLSERRAPPPRPGISVDVYIPTYSEPIDLVRKTALAAMAMDYPHRTWILDDGRREAMRALATELGCEYLTRTDNAHAKAGNLNHALAGSSGELIAVFDADHAPRRDFLVKTLGYFEDTRVAFVQTPQDYYNLDSYQHRGTHASHEIWTEQALFFRVIQRGKDCWNSAFFCGSCAVVRRSALERIGGFATGTITEDLHTSIRLHAAGFRSVYHAARALGSGRHARVAHRGHPLQSGLELGAATQLPCLGRHLLRRLDQGLVLLRSRRGVALRVRAAGGRDADVLAAFRAVLPAHVLGVRGGWARLRPHRLHRAIQHGALRGFCLGDAGLDLPKRPVPGYPQAVARAALAPLHDAAVAGGGQQPARGPRRDRHLSSRAFAAAGWRGRERAVGRRQLRTGSGGPATHAGCATAAARAVSLPGAAAGGAGLCRSAYARHDRQSQRERDSVLRRFASLHRAGQ